MSDVLSVKIDKDKLKMLEEIARAEESDRSTVARKLLDIGIRQWRIERAIKSFSEGRLSIWKAADTAGVTLREFIDILNERRITWVKIKPEELEAEVKAMLREKN